MPGPNERVRATLDPELGLLRLALRGEKANILDRRAVAEIGAAVESQGNAPSTRAILFTGEGSHFSFGSSIEEHRRAEIAAVLPEFHALFRRLARSRRVLLASVRGNCLGGGLELAAFCHRVFAAPDARLGQPEIRLGVFAPVASLVLPRRIGQAAAVDLLLSGRTVEAAEALRLGLVDEVAADPEAAAVAWVRAALADKSASSLGFAVEAARAPLNADLGEPLSRLERLYLDALMGSRDANEGIAAFLEKRAPRWTNS
jgi:cyclohexa-1,5-dienecarbonyl-CoA hydratase